MGRLLPVSVPCGTSGTVLLPGHQASRTRRLCVLSRDCRPSSGANRCAGRASCALSQPAVAAAPQCGGPAEVAADGAALAGHCAWLLGRGAPAAVSGGAAASCAGASGMPPARREAREHSVVVCGRNIVVATGRLRPRSSGAPARLRAPASVCVCACVARPSGTSAGGGSVRRPPGRRQGCARSDGGTLQLGLPTRHRGSDCRCRHPIAAWLVSAKRQG